ncbi:MAG: aminodeoxychorismate synthase component [Pseudomonadota bacterium]
MNTPVYAIAFDPENRLWLHFTSPVRLYTARSATEVVSTMTEVERACTCDGVWAVGWVSYEAAPGFDPALEVREEHSFPKVWFATFRPPTPLTSLSNHTPPELMSWAPSITKEEYLQGVGAVKEAIARGDTYQTNYSFRLTTPVTPDPHHLLGQMIGSQGGAYGCLIHTEEFAIVSASPELFFSKRGTTLTSRPMKGTSPRGRTLEEDRSLANELQSSPKNRAENIMIVDMTRNDLSRIAHRGSVQWPEVCAIEKYPPMFQMTSEVQATTDASLVDIFRALFPAASITGAPKAATMRIIAERESTPRRIYTGAIGVITPHDRAWFNVAIRTAMIDYPRGITEYGVGSGIVWDSSSADEYEECLAKAAAITRAPTPCELFETILWEPSKGFFLLDKHLDRISQGAEYFAWPFKREEALTILEHVQPELTSGKQPFRVRLFLTSAGSFRTDHALLKPLPTPYRLSLAQHPISSSDRSLYRKTTDRRAYDSALPLDPTAHDVILWNERGEITETKIANIAVELDGKLYTPPITSGLLDGCYRRVLLEREELTERALTKEDLARATRVIVLNSVRRSWEGTLCDKSDSITA